MTQSLTKGGDKLFLFLISTNGGEQKVGCADTQGIFRIIQSIPSKKAELFKQWFAKFGAERIDQIVDPEKSIEQALEHTKDEA